ncbi:reverse transcriptase [Plakobranchus ocellatus]|uniref:Reverse transcriptase n=1 Tax=Plakobranchus ocellatus TaxID=259542 RepID=A0AAV3XW74_9GAST|nr:reverse transcriptase [Plakobranchus ocellatus]
MAPPKICFLIRAVYDFLPSNYANLVRWAMKDDPTRPLCQGKQTKEHILSSCKEALGQGRYTWRYNRVLQEPVLAICDAKGLPAQTKTTAQEFTTEGGTKSFCGSAAGMDTQRKSLLDE